MKNLLFERNEGGNYPASHYYYTFDSKAEYDAFVADLREGDKAMTITEYAERLGVNWRTLI